MEKQVKTTKEDIKRGLKKLGLKKGDTVLVHSSLGSMGKVEGGAETVILALQETLGRSGTLMMPYPLGGATIARVFSESRGVVRSLHPTHSVSAWGAGAGAFTRDHIKSPTACGRETPYGRLVAGKGLILLLGVDQDRNTTLHTVEEYANLPYLSEHRVEYTDATGRKRAKTLKKYPGPHRNFIGIDRLLAESGAMKTGRIGQAEARLVNASMMADKALKELKTNRALFLCDNPDCMDCVMQRGKLGRIRLNGEPFRLAAVLNTISRDTGKAFQALETEGINRVELCNTGKTRPTAELKKQIEKRGIAVSGIDAGDVLSSSAGALEKILAKARSFQAEYVVVRPPLSGSQQAVPGKTFAGRLAAASELAGKYRIDLVLENMPGSCCSSSADCLKLMESVKSPRLKIAFNPANFAAAGEKPFLQTPTSLRKWIKVLYVNDGLFSGLPRLPGYGNAEIKELVSIMRCRSFCGFFSIKHGLDATPDNFHKAVRAFQRLLETM